MNSHWQLKLVHKHTTKEAQKCNRSKKCYWVNKVNYLISSMRVKLAVKYAQDDVQVGFWDVIEDVNGVLSRFCDVSSYNLLFKFSMSFLICALIRVQSAFSIRKCLSPRLQSSSGTFCKFLLFALLVMFICALLHVINCKQAKWSWSWKWFVKRHFRAYLSCRC